MEREGEGAFFPGDGGKGEGIQKKNDAATKKHRLFSFLLQIPTWTFLCERRKEYIIL